MVIKGEIRKLNHKLIGEETRRNSVALDTLSSTFGNVSKTPGNTKTPEFSCRRFDPAVVQPHPTPLDMDAERNSPSAPPASQEDFYALDRLLNDEGGPPSAPLYADMLNDLRGSATFDEINHSDGVHLPSRNIGDHTSGRSRGSSLRGIRVDEGRQKVMNDNPISGNDNEEENDGFILVRNRKRRKNVIGSRQTSSIKSAVRMGDLYIGNCDLSVTTESLSEYIRDEIDVSIDSCEQLNSHSAYSNSFKVTLNMKDRLRLLTPDVWPEGIVCRKFFKPRKANNS